MHGERIWRAGNTAPLPLFTAIGQTNTEGKSIARYRLRNRICHVAFIPFLKTANIVWKMIEIGCTHLANVLKKTADSINSNTDVKK